MLLTSPRRKNLILLAATMVLTTAAHASITATANITDTQVSPGVYDYSITLNNTGTTTIGTFWFSWVPGAGFLSATPTDILSPTGWSEITTNAGKAIQWKTTTSLLNPGNSLSGFSFDSSETPDQLLAAFAGPGTGTGDPVTTSFVYIAAPLADPGNQFVASLTQPQTVTPEPSTMLLFLTGGSLALVSLKSKFLQAVR